MREAGSKAISLLYKIAGFTEPPLTEICCSCGKLHVNGNFFSGDPQNFLCKGDHQQ
jgi:hypothetical protein